MRNKQTNKQTNRQTDKPTIIIANIGQYEQYEIKSHSLKLNKNCIDHYHMYLISAMVR
jgi:ribosome-binding ATPase YchF (GTP1/OBG family)